MKVNFGGQVHKPLCQGSKLEIKGTKVHGYCIVYLVNKNYSHKMFTWGLGKKRCYAALGVLCFDTKTAATTITTITATIEPTTTGNMSSGMPRVAGLTR